MLQLQEITEDNFLACLDLDPGPSGQGHVDSVQYSLAEAWSNRPCSYPKAIYQGEELVGYVSLYIEKQHGQIINFMIDKTYQGKGLGKESARLCLDYFKTEHGATVASLPVHPENVQAKAFWESIGFQETGRKDGSYSILECQLA